MSPTNDLLFQDMGVIMLTLDGAGMFTSLNPAAERCFARSAAELLGQPLTTVLDPFSAEKAATMIARTLSEGGVTDWELDHVQPAGPPVLVGYTTTALRDDAGVVVGLGALGRDLSAKLELTAQLAETNQQLEGALLQLERSHAALKARRCSWYSPRRCARWARWWPAWPTRSTTRPRLSPITWPSWLS
jgi:PAS domain S-box-containing protein